MENCWAGLEYKWEIGKRNLGWNWNWFVLGGGNGKFEIEEDVGGWRWNWELGGCCWRGRRLALLPILEAAFTFPLETSGSRAESGSTFISWPRFISRRSLSCFILSSFWLFSSTIIVKFPICYRSPESYSKQGRIFHRPIHSAPPNSSSSLLLLDPVNCLAPGNRTSRSQMPSLDMKLLIISCHLIPSLSDF